MRITKLVPMRRETVSLKTSLNGHFFFKLGPVDLLALLHVLKYYIQNDHAKHSNIKARERTGHKLLRRGRNRVVTITYVFGMGCG